MKMTPKFAPTRSTTEAVVILSMLKITTAGTEERYEIYFLAIHIGLYIIEIVATLELQDLMFAVNSQVKTGITSIFTHSGMKMTPKFAPTRSTIEAVKHSSTDQSDFIICTIKHHLIDFFFNHAF